MTDEEMKKHDAKTHFNTEGQVSYTRKMDKGFERGGISFTHIKADLDGDVVDQSKMRAALNRFAKTLTDQLRKKDVRIRGVIFDSINFTMILQRKKET